MDVTSFRADAIVEKAKLCYELGLIREETLDRVTERAYSDPEYTAIIDLPLDFEVAEEQERRKEHDRLERHLRRRSRLRSLLRL